MSSSEPFFPSNFQPRHEPHDDRDLQIGPLDGPDSLQEEGEPEPDLSEVELKHDLPIRKPTVGEHLTVEQLTEELGGA